MVSTRKRHLKHLTARVTAVLQNGGGPAFAPGVSAKSFIVIVGTRGIMIAKQGSAAGLCHQRSNQPNNVGARAFSGLRTQVPRQVVRRTIGNVLPGAALNHRRFAGLGICTKSRRPRRTRSPRSLIIGAVPKRTGWYELLVGLGTWYVKRRITKDLQSPRFT